MSAARKTPSKAPAAPTSRGLRFRCHVGEGQGRDPEQHPRPVTDRRNENVNARQDLRWLDGDRELRGCGFMDAVIHSWDTDTGKEVGKYPVVDSSKFEIARDGYWSESELDFGDNKRAHRMLALHPDGKRAVCLTCAEDMLVFDLTTGKKLGTFGAAFDTFLPRTFAFSPDGEWFACFAGCSYAVLSFEQGRLSQKKPSPPRRLGVGSDRPNRIVGAAVFASPRTELVVVSTARLRITSIDLDAEPPQRQTRLIKPPATQLQAAYVLPDRETVLARRGGKPRVKDGGAWQWVRWDLTTNTFAWTLSGRWHSATLSGDGAVAVLWGDSEVALVSLDDGSLVDRLTFSLPEGTRLGPVSLSASGKRLAVGHPDGKVAIYEVRPPAAPRSAARLICQPHARSASRAPLPEPRGARWPWYGGFRGREKARSLPPSKLSCSPPPSISSAGEPMPRSSKLPT